MWFQNLTTQKAFALASLFLTSGVSAAALPKSPVDLAPSFVADVPTNTQISTTGADGKPTSVPIVDVPNCRFCRDDDEDELTTGGGALPGISGSETDQASAASSLESIPVITVSSSGDSSDAPSQTTHQPATQAKRAATATKTDDKYRALKKALGKTPEVGKGYAIKIKSERNMVSGKRFVSHYVIAAGYVIQETEGNTVLLKFDAGCWDIQLDDGKISFEDRNGDSWYNWDAKFTVLGKIKSGLTFVDVEEYGTAIAKEMNDKGYHLLMNNCRDFVNKLYAKLKA
ncbi:hypothetical protein BO78DRAFT_356969 [Aspergillus sclerotiicarbonarius CBS 121057]|uniref:Uncharacterized protein n=1 Tax=Aspergillus sclerotiicarbonarius (strain CBS 121057 / IBT 28362) TaxID=1448318 RepID=A0A319EWY3_ASPSB|nr:hypothetical protein BO78DRAFT_356969 [Aspergillus sclerotiicarbonarius CBS 121057]